MSKVKVIIVGGGLSGLSAAHTVLERGGNVLLLDKNSFMGGNSTKATSGINGANTQIFLTGALGIPDTSAKFFADTKKSARELARDDLIHVLTYQSGDAVNWLIEKFNLDLSKVSRLGGHSEKRTHRGTQQFPGMTITYALMEKLEDMAEQHPDRVKILKKAKATKLLQENGKVIGVDYEREGKHYTEYGPVVLATGGYAADFTSDSLLKQHRPEYYNLPTTNGDHCTGDGHKMAMLIGAKGIDLEKVQVHPTGLVDPKDPDAKVKFLAAEALRGVGGLLINRDGERFVDELEHRDHVTGKMWENNKFPVRLVLNSTSTKEIEWHCKHYVGRGLMKKFNSGEELAKEIGCSPDALKKTFDDHNRYAKNPGTDPFGKKFFSGGDFTMSDTYHAAIMTPVLHYTMGGLEIGTNAAVHNANGGQVEGLYACGELAGGVHGANRLGGSSLLGCVVFGRVAGDSVSAYLLSHLTNSDANAKAAKRLGTINNHLVETKIKLDPESSALQVSFSWGGDQGETSDKSQKNAGGAQVPADSAPGRKGDRTVAEVEPEALPTPPAKKGAGKDTSSKKEYTREEVAKHNTEKDCWVVIGGQVLDVTNFLEDHPGGVKAILLYAGRDATEEFDMIHPPNAIAKYAPDTVIGTIKG
ncbi:fumarate reductase [Cryptococcus gattii Ru294]|nr:fumarate reductase [Cryptococcus gattii Ru294]